MKVLVVGGGGREHAICWKLRQSPELAELYCAPGNPGIEKLADLVPIATEEIHQLADFAQDLKIDLTIVGPELPLSLGIADEFAKRDLRLFGPQQHAAQLESSKVFAKQFMERHAVPTAPFEVAHDATELGQASEKVGFPLVVKADGLAAGKGVVIVRTPEELDGVSRIFFEERRFAASGDRVVVEPFLEGEEVSFISVSDGQRVLPLATSKDYKRIGDGDTGPNTGGMGAHSPSGVMSADDAATILDQVIRPVISGLEVDNTRFVGFLYAGLMLTEEGPRVLEFNVRLGDPEAQAILLRMEDDLLALATRGADGDFGTNRLHFRKEAAACIVLAAKGYPDNPVRGDVITGIERAESREGVVVFHAGTKRENDRLVSAGGRVLDVCATGPELRDALKRAYGAASEIRWKNRVLRKDIGRRVLQGEGAAGAR